jgi:hypothetical protein
MYRLRETSLSNGFRKKIGKPHIGLGEYPAGISNPYEWKFTKNTPEFMPLKCSRVEPFSPKPKFPLECHCKQQCQFTTRWTLHLQQKADGQPTEVERRRFLSKYIRCELLYKQGKRKVLKAQYYIPDYKGRQLRVCREYFQKVFKVGSGVLKKIHDEELFGRRMHIRFY